MAKILTSYYRPKPGGLCKRLFQAINALLADGHTLHYLAVVPFPIVHPNCHFHRFPWPEDKTEGLLFWGVFHIFTPLMFIYIGYKHRITHIFAFANTYSFLMQPLRLIKCIPLSLFLRADTVRNHKMKGKSRWLLALESCIEGLSIINVHLYGVSESLTAEVTSRHRLFKPKHARTLRNNINNLPRLFAKKDCYASPLRVACVGILEKRKNQRLLLEVMEKVRPEQAQLYLYGVGLYERQLKRIALEKGVDMRVHFMGWVEANLIWQHVDLLLTPSLHEGAPNAVLEALAQGIPVLASDIPEHREILPLDCLLSPYEPLTWLDRLQKILQEPNLELKKICVSQFPYAKILYFDWNKTICKHILKS